MMKGGIRLFGSHWERTILVCRRCSKRLDGGFGAKGRTPLAKALRREIRERRGRKATIGIVEVKCLGVCPRAAVTVVDAAKPGEWLLVPQGSDIGGLARQLGLDDRAGGG